MGANKRQTPDPKGGRQMNTPVGKSTYKSFDNIPNFCTYSPTLLDYFNTQLKEAVLYLWETAVDQTSSDDDTPVPSQQPKGLKGRQAKGGEWSCLFLLFLCRQVFLCLQASWNLAGTRRWRGCWRWRSSQCIYPFARPCKYLISVSSLTHISPSNLPYQSYHISPLINHISHCFFHISQLISVRNIFDISQ